LKQNLAAVGIRPIKNLVDRHNWATMATEPPIPVFAGKKSSGKDQQFSRPIMQRHSFLSTAKKEW
jgi:hypothetical protein